MENNITAEEFLKSKGLFNDKSIRLQNMGMTSSEAMIEFAKLHVEAQRKDIITDLRANYTSDSYIESIVNNAYPLTNIK
jgi:hypothetical protein